MYKKNYNKTTYKKTSYKKKDVTERPLSKDVKYLIIVESPSKCQKIEAFLGSQYHCIASKGHIRTIAGLTSIDYKNNFDTEFTIIEDNKSHIESMQKTISQFPKENIILGLNTFNGEDVYASMFSPEEQMLTVKNWPFVVVNTSFHYTYHTEQRIPENEFKQSRHRERNYYFLFKVRRPREHRLMLLYSFACTGLLDKADWSCLSSIEFNQHEIDHFSQLTNIKLDSASSIYSEYSLITIGLWG
jgi:hypothetical protein